MKPGFANLRSIPPALLSIVLLLTGCGRKDPEEGLVVVTPSVTAPPILRSEADQIAVPLRVNAPIRFENRSGVNQSVGISKTGCSCYGIATPQSIWNPGELISVRPGGELEVYFVAKELKADSEQAFRVAFHAGPPLEGSSAKGSRELRADCSMKIFPDLVLDPASIVVDLVQDRPADSESRELTITRITRGEVPDSGPPAFSMSPALLKAEPASQKNPAVEISPGLWRTVWKTSVHREQFPEEVQGNGGRFAFNFAFPEGGDASSARLSRVPREDRIPTILEVVEISPHREISGQLILRRSSGIIVPSQLHFGVIPGGSAPRKRRLVLSAADHRPFQVTACEVPSPFSAEPDSEEPAEQQWITVTFRPVVTGDSQGKLTLKTSHPDQPEVLVKLKARVQ